MTGPLRAQSADATIDALQRAVAAEHAAVFVYGVLGAQTSRTKQAAFYAALLDGYRTHQMRRDTWMDLLRDAGVEPEAPPAGYDPGDTSSPRAIRNRARQLEADCAQTYAFVVANTINTVRRAAAEALTDAAIRGLGFGARTEELPGI